MARVVVRVPGRLWSRRVKVVAGPAARLPHPRASVLLAVVEPLPGRWRVEPHIVWASGGEPPEGPAVQVRGRLALVEYDGFKAMAGVMAGGAASGLFQHYHVPPWGFPLIVPEEAGPAPPAVAARIDELAGLGVLYRWVRGVLAGSIEVVEV